jgi:hypothetical protein
MAISLRIKDSRIHISAGSYILPDIYLHTLFSGQRVSSTKVAVAMTPPPHPSYFWSSGSSKIGLPSNGTLIPNCRAFLWRWQLGTGPK